MNADLGIIIHSSDPETVWNAFRLAQYAADQKDKVRVFLLGRGVEAQGIGTKNFDVAAMMRAFIDAGGEILACGTCLKLRGAEGSELCPISTLADLHELVKHADRILTF